MPHVSRGLCKNCYNREWYAKNPDKVREITRRTYQKNREKILAHTREWRKNNKEQRKIYDYTQHLKKKFGITVDQYNAMLAAQDGVCAVCHRAETAKDNTKLRVKALSIDHDHETNKIRELLCAGCNTVLGLVEDDPEHLRLLIAYLGKHGTH